MGGIKRYMEQIEAEEMMEDWIRENADLGVEPGDPEWEELKALYLSGEAFTSEWDDYEVDSYTDDEKIFAIFSDQMSLLKSELSDEPSELSLKMTYSYSVTLMETCLGDMVKSLVMSDEHYLKNAIANVSELKDQKIPLMEIFKNHDIVKKTVLKTFSGYLYHKIEKIVPIYSSVLDEPTPDGVRDKMGNIIKIAKIRHDIVHRNGSDIDGNAVELNREVLMKAMNDIHSFVMSLRFSIDSARQKRLQKEFSDLYPETQ
ncbi:hypothetical protein ACN6UN_000198 [Cronobacter turicensis]|nr:hypothetical protein [Cronobacter turicensis]